MRTELRKTLQPINVLLAFLGVQGALLAWAPECSAVLASSTAAACGLGYLAYRRFDRPALHRQALRESEGRYAALVASLREGILVRERDGTLSACNPGTERIFGLPQESILGRTTLLPDVQYVNPDGTPFDVNLQPGHLALTTGGPVDDVEFGILRRDGGSRWVVASARPLFRDGESVPHAAVVSLNDITDRRTAERELERQRTFLRTVLDAVPNLIAVRDRGHRYAMVNRTTADFYGVSPKQMIGKPYSDFIDDPAQAEAIERSDSQLLSSGEGSRSYESEVADAAGVRRWLQVSRRVIGDRYGAPNLVLVVGADITERKRLQEELKHMLEVRNTILENSIAGIALLDGKGRMVWVNRAIEEMFGADRGAFDGKSIEPFYLSREDYLATGAAASKAVLAGQAYEAELRMRRSDGTAFWVNLSGKAVNPADLSRGTVWVTVDITERRRAEGQLQRMNEELERRVAERTTQLEASVKELEAYSYTISHDLRAPLRAIDGFSQILIEEARGGLEPQARACLDKISQNARRMAELIDRLLAFARFSRAPLERRAIDLDALVRSVIDEQPREGREIEFGIAPLQRCRADAQLLRQVFGNLVSNAVKYTRPREAAKIEIGAFERDGATVYFVRDNGVGFDMAFVHKLFGVFQRLHSDQEFEGTGAGLAIVQRIVTRHGGRAWAEGEVGKGAAFYFTLGGEALAAGAR